ncbi:DUF2894 domain-containing protein [Cupriavidus necator]
MNNDRAADARAMLDAWRESGADRVDPVRFRFMEALARRAAGHGGDARRLLDDRLSGLVEAYGQALQRAECTADHAGGTVQPGESASGTLAGLVDYMRANAQTMDHNAASRTPAPRRIAPAAPELIDYFRDTWTRVSIGQQLRQSLERVPEHAGPLNSNHLVHRSLSLMREMSPGYLEHFLSYVDAMSWLEQLNGGGVAVEKEATRVAGAKKAVRGKVRK